MVKTGMKQSFKERRQFEEKAFLLNVAGLVGDMPGLLTFKPRMAMRQADSRLLAASGQFLAWTVGNNGIDPTVAAMIKQHWETRDSSQSRVDYIDAAVMMARRIHNFVPLELRPLVEDLYVNDVMVPRKLIESLMKRRSLFERPAVVTSLATRSKFNVGEPKPQMLTAS